MNAAFNDEEVLQFNKCAVIQPTRKMAQCQDYPESDLAEFYEILAHSENPDAVYWSLKAVDLWEQHTIRHFSVRREK